MKTPRDGYDGKGVAVVDLDGRGRLRGAGGFQSWFADAPDGLLLEERVGFSSEIAQLVARRPSGQIASWCAVETIQRRGVCLETVAPATVEPAVADEARRIAERVAESLDVVGVLAVEMFVAEDRVLVNELAMRPHNSGHWTIDGAVTSQFEQHLRAVLDLPLGSTAPVVPRTVMVNVLTSRLPDPRRAYPEAMAAYPDVKFHAYGKAVAPLRKIGHVTAGGDDVEEVRARAEAVGELPADVELRLGVGHEQRLGVGVHGDELHALEPDLDHAVDGVDATAADANDFDHCQVVLRRSHGCLPCIKPSTSSGRLMLYVLYVGKTVEPRAPVFKTTRGRPAC